MSTRQPDGRLLVSGKPAAEVRLHRGWFVITEADGPGVRLETRIPGMERPAQWHASQEDATVAAGRIYDEYARPFRKAG